MVKDWEQRELRNLIESYDEIIDGHSNYPIATSSRKGLYLQSEYFNGKRTGIDKTLRFRRVPVNYVTYRHMSDDSIFKFNQNTFETDVLVSKEYPVFKATENSNQEFLIFHLNNTQNFLKFSAMQKLGGTRVRLYYKNLIKYKMKIPQLNEQRKVAGFLISLEKIIELHQHKINKINLIKVVFLKNLFPQKSSLSPNLRFESFKDEWRVSKLGEFVKIKTGKLDANAMVENGEFDFYTSGIKKYKIDHYAFEGPAITIAGNGATVGHMHYADGLFNAYQRTYVLSDFTANREFLYQVISLLLPEKIRKEARTGNIPYIVLEMLTGLDLIIPILDEQKKIGGLLEQLNKYINLHQRKINNFNKLKKVYLNKMFL